MIEAIIILLGMACGMQADYVTLFDSSVGVACYGESDGTKARDNLNVLEDLYNVVYVTQVNQHPLASEGIMGQAWHRNGDNYAYAVNNYEVIKHEFLHLTEKAYFTSDGRHHGEKDQYRWLWDLEQQ
jgi:hypothetical protein